MKSMKGIEQREKNEKDKGRDKDVDKERGIESRERERQRERERKKVWRARNMWCHRKRHVERVGGEIKRCGGRERKEEKCGKREKGKKRE